MVDPPPPPPRAALSLLMILNAQKLCIFFKQEITIDNTFITITNAAQP